MKVILIRSRAITPGVFKVAKALALAGHDVKLLIWDRQNTLQECNEQGCEIYKFRLKAPYDSAKVIIYHPIWWLYELYLLLKIRCDVIHACDLDTLPPAVFVKLLKRKKLCETRYDYYANHITKGKFNFLRAFLRKCISFTENTLIRFTDALFLVDESRYENIKDAKIKKLVYVYNSPPDSFKKGVSQKLTSGGTKILLFYAGLLTKSRGLEHMIKAIENFDNVTLVFAGTGPEKDYIDKTARQSPKIQYLGQIQYTEVIEITLAADVLFAFYDPKIPNSKYASPNKLFEAMMCAKPIIVSDRSSMADIVVKENCGIVVPYGDIVRIQRAIQKLKDPEYRDTLGVNGRKAYEERYSWEIMESRLLELYSCLKNEEVD